MTSDDIGDWSDTEDEHTSSSIRKTPLRAAAAQFGVDAAWVPPEREPVITPSCIRTRSQRAILSQPDDVSSPSPSKRQKTFSPPLYLKTYPRTSPYRADKVVDQTLLLPVPVLAAGNPPEPGHLERLIDEARARIARRHQIHNKQMRHHQNGELLEPALLFQADPDLTTTEYDPSDFPDYGSDSLSDLSLADPSDGYESNEDQRCKWIKYEDFKSEPMEMESGFISLDQQMTAARARLLDRQRQHSVKPVRLPMTREFQESKASLVEDLPLLDIPATFVHTTESLIAIRQQAQAIWEASLRYPLPAPAIDTDTSLFHSHSKATFGNTCIVDGEPHYWKRNFDSIWPDAGRVTPLLRCSGPTDIIAHMQTIKEITQVVFFFHGNLNISHILALAPALPVAHDVEICAHCRSKECILWPDHLLGTSYQYFKHMLEQVTTWVTGLVARGLFLSTTDVATVGNRMAIWIAYMDRKVLLETFSILHPGLDICAVLLDASPNGWLHWMTEMFLELADAVFLYRVRVPRGKYDDFIMSEFQSLAPAQDLGSRPCITAIPVSGELSKCLRALLVES